MRPTHRNVLGSALAAALLAAPAAAQATHSLPVDQVSKVDMPVRDAGTYHLATGTWTRRASGEQRRGSSNRIYSNTAFGSTFLISAGPTGNAAGGVAIDAAELPPPPIPVPSASAGRSTSTA